MGWAEFALAFAAFFLTHALPIRPPLRPWLVARLGARGFGLGYAALSLAVLVWLVGATGRAPFVPLWTPAPWQRLVPLAAMVPSCLILALSLGRPNPFSFGGARNGTFDPSAPGIVRLTRHPLLLALAIWAGAHVVRNGDLAHVILFGSFAVFALLDQRLVDRRRRREMGADWARLDAARRMTQRVGALPAGPGLAARLVLGTALYLALVLLHPLLVGPSPLP